MKWVKTSTNCLFLKDKMKKEDIDPLLKQEANA